VVVRRSLFSIYIILLVLLLCACLPEGSLPAPTVVSANFIYTVRVTNEINEPIVNAKVIIEFRGSVPIDGTSDSNGYVSLSLPSTESGQRGSLVIEASGYDSKRQDVDLNENQLPKRYNLIQQSTLTPTDTPTPVPTDTPTPVPTDTPTPVPTDTPTPVPTDTPTLLPTDTPTPVPTDTPTPVPTDTPTPVPTDTPTPVPTFTAAPVHTATPLPAVIVTQVPASTAAPRPTFTVTALPTLAPLSSYNIRILVPEWGQSFQGWDDVRWSYNGPLQPGQGFELCLWYIGGDGRPADTRCLGVEDARTTTSNTTYLGNYEYVAKDIYFSDAQMVAQYCDAKYMLVIRLVNLEPYAELGPKSEGVQIQVAPLPNGPCD